LSQPLQDFPYVWRSFSHATGFLSSVARAALPPSAVEPSPLPTPFQRLVPKAQQQTYQDEHAWVTATEVQVQAKLAAQTSKQRKVNEAIAASHLQTMARYSSGKEICE
jgi:hypothetical protein